MVYYFDRTQVNGAVGLFAGEGNQVVYTGTKIHREPEKYRKLAKTFTQKTGLNFWFGEEGPEENLYTVPEMELTAYDALGGYLAQCNDVWVYIDAEKTCYRLPEEPPLLSLPDNWRESMEPTSDIHIYSSRAEAEQAFEIHNFPQPMV